MHSVAPTCLLDAAATLVNRVAVAGDGDISSVLAAIAGRPGAGADRWFEPSEVTWVEWEQALTAPELLQAVAGTSVWPLLAPHEASALALAIEQMVDALGGSYLRRRVTFLAVARRAGG